MCQSLSSQQSSCQILRGGMEVSFFKEIKITYREAGKCSDKLSSLWTLRLPHFNLLLDSNS